MFNTPFGVPVSVILLSIIVSYLYVLNLRNTEEIMANNGLLFVSNAAKLHNVCQIASKFVQKVLYVKVNGTSDGALPVISRQIANLYSRATTQCSNLDVRLMLRPGENEKSINTNNQIDVILYDSDLDRDVDKLKQIVPAQKTDLLCIGDLEPLSETGNEEPVKTYEYVALGGTFDRLHNGHKILLSQAVLRSTKHVTVGVCDENMIKSKKLWELIEPVEKRIEAVLNFLNDVNPDLEYNVLPIHDLYGPTKDGPEFQLIVVSEETIKGAMKINEKRKENNIPVLDTYVIGLAQDTYEQRSEEEEAKVSSSNQRMRLLGTLLKPPMPNPNIPDWPYVIGLAGGIASGKSSIAEKLQAKGAAIVNCDFIAHDLYKPGLPLNDTIAATFGREVITETGEVNRRKLGEIVFSDKTQLERLNQVLWPEIIQEAQRRVRALGEQGYQVVVMEAAVMVRAQWYHYCHQLWAVIIPPEEAIRRLQKRNNLTEEEARQRIDSQPSNSEQVSLANVVFSPYWSYEYTQGQIDRAWEQLQQYLDNRK